MNRLAEEIPVSLFFPPKLSRKNSLTYEFVFLGLIEKT